MNKELATLLKSKLSALPFIDMLAGLVQTVTTEERDANGVAKIQKRFPVAYDTNDTRNCTVGPERMLIPDSSRRSIIYFEDFGSSATNESRGQLRGMSSSIRLICWLNRAKLVGDNYTEISGRMMSMILDKLITRNPENNGMFTKLIVKVARIPPQDPALFGRYTYSEVDRQYLRPPFEFFGIDLACTYFVNSNCINEIEWKDPVCY